MIVYKGIIKDFVDRPDAVQFCKEHGIVYFQPSKERMVWLKNWYKKNKNMLPVIETEEDVDCWFRPYGVWGEYSRDEGFISICPFEIERCGGLEDTIRHELAHLRHPEADSMSHEDKEDYINKQ